MKMWKGRFTKELNELANDFNASIRIDQRMFEEDIQGSIAHARMLNHCEIISDEDFEKIETELKKIRTEIQNQTLEVDLKAEDIHMFIEEELTKRIGTAGKRLHTARSRNDQVALDNKLYLRKEIEEITTYIILLIERIIDVAMETKDAVMPGYTHLQIAQPVTFAHHIMAYAQMFFRDVSRFFDLRKRMNECPLGAGALATTTYPIDRFMTAEELRFDKPTRNSMDSVSDRDYMIEMNVCVAMTMMHLSRFSEEIIMWSSQEFKYISLDDSFSTGSSIMPQKKNPDMAELVRGKTGRAYGNLMATLTMMKGTPLSYNKDMQEDKEITFDSIDTLIVCLKVFDGMLETMTIYKDRMRQMASKGFINATDCADYLVRKGLAFRDAYKITGELVLYGVEHEVALEEIPLNTLQEYSPLLDKDVYQYLDLDYILSKRDTYGGPSPKAVQRQINDTEVELRSLVRNFYSIFNK